MIALGAKGISWELFGAAALLFWASAVTLSLVARGILWGLSRFRAAGTRDYFLTLTLPVGVSTGLFLLTVWLCCCHPEMAQAILSRLFLHRELGFLSALLFLGTLGGGGVIVGSSLRQELSLRRRRIAMLAGGPKGRVFWGTIPPEQSATVGIFHPWVLLGVDLREIMTDEELRAVVLHEMEHVRRRDPLQTFLARMACLALWFVPGTRQLYARWRLEVEVCCDRLAATTLSSPMPVVAALLKLAAFIPSRRKRREMASVAGVSREAGALMERLRRLLAPHGDGVARSGALPLGIWVGLVVGWVGLLSSWHLTGSVACLVRDLLRHLHY